MGDVEYGAEDEEDAPPALLLAPSLALCDCTLSCVEGGTEGERGEVEIGRRRRGGDDEQTIGARG